MDRFFYQDFLFENMPVDFQGNIDVEEEYVFDDSQSYDNYNVVSFDKLLRTTSKDKWEEYKKTSKAYDGVMIVDDVEIKNEELQEYKCFYLKTYYHFFTQNSQKCVIKNK